MKSRIVLLGAPGSGKGTQAEMITRHFAIAVTSPGTILRRERDLGTPLGIKADEISKQGGLVPDEIIVHLIEDWLALHGKDGFVFDGFPRTVKQGERLNEILQKRQTALDLAIWLEVSERTVRDRIAGRLQCQAPVLPTVQFVHIAMDRLFVATTTMRRSWRPDSQSSRPRPSHSFHFTKKMMPCIASMGIGIGKRCLPISRP